MVSQKYQHWNPLFVAHSWPRLPQYIWLVPRTPQKCAEDGGCLQAYFDFAMHTLCANMLDKRKKNHDKRLMQAHIYVSLGIIYWVWQSISADRTKLLATFQTLSQNNGEAQYKELLVASGLNKSDQRRKVCKVRMWQSGFWGPWFQDPWIIASINLGDWEFWLFQVSISCTVDKSTHGGYD